MNLADAGLVGRLKAWKTRFQAKTRQISRRDSVDNPEDGVGTTGDYSSIP